MSAAEDAEWLRWVTKQFGSIAGEDKEIGLEEFKRALQVKEVSAPPGPRPPGSAGSPASSRGLLLYLAKIKLKNRNVWCCVGEGRREKPRGILQRAGVENTD